MKLIIKITLIWAFLLTPHGVRNSPLKFSEPTLPVSAVGSSYIAMDEYSERTLFGENVSSKRYPASLTKILTAITALENADEDGEVKILKESCGVEGSSVYLREGEVYTLKTLLYGLMLRSGNDAADAIARYVAGGISEFADLMNETAEKIGANGSHFTNPHGLHDENHYTTAYDLAKITAYALKNGTLSEIVKTKKITIGYKDENGEDRKKVFVNKNKMLGLYDGATGVKTGFTKIAGRCLVSSATRGGLSVITVVLNEYDMWEKSKKLLDEAFETYKPVTLIKSDEMTAFIDIEDDAEKCGLYVKSDVILPLTDEESKNLKTEYEHVKVIKKPFKKDEAVGEIKFFALNKLIFCEKIYTIIGKE